MIFEDHHRGKERPTFSRSQYISIVKQRCPEASLRNKPHYGPRPQIAIQYSVMQSTLTDTGFFAENYEAGHIIEFGTNQKAVYKEGDEEYLKHLAAIINVDFGRCCVFAGMCYLLCSDSCSALIEMVECKNEKLLYSDVA